MSIRDVSGLPDDQVPDWVRRSRERTRADRIKLCSCQRHFGRRTEILDHCDLTGHLPLVPSADDRFLKRSPSGRPESRPNLQNIPIRQEDE